MEAFHSDGTKEFEVYLTGVRYCKVCTSLTNLEEITKRVNEENPTGVENKWEVAKENLEESNPSPCISEPKNHKHYLFVW
jgi:hypothetical protein